MNRLKELRDDKNLYQKDVAKMLGVAYVSYNTWERENDIIPLKQLDKFCEIFEKTLEGDVTSPFIIRADLKRSCSFG